MLRRLSPEGPSGPDVVMNHEASAQDERIAAQAAAWVVRLRADVVSEADWLEAAAWLDAAAAHRLAFDEAESLWAALDKVPLVQPATVSDLAAFRERRQGPVRRWLIAAPAIAAAVTAAVLLAPLLQSAPVQVYRTAPGETRVVTLDDGTRLSINGGSSLSVKMERGLRTVRMDRAEVLFDVAHDASRPFEVTVGESRVRVLGTAFNIRRTDEVTEVAVTRGLVQVSDLDTPGHQVRLGVGQQVRRDDATDQLQTGVVDPVAATAWTEGRRVYDNRPLSEVATDLTRTFATPVTVSSGAAGLRFSGVLILDDEDAVIARIERFLPVRATRESGTIRLERR